MFKSVLAQSLVTIGFTAYGLFHVVLTNRCTGDSKSCAEFKSGNLSLSIKLFIITVIGCTVLAVLAFFALRRQSKVLGVIIAIIEALLIIGAISAFKTGADAVTMVRAIAVVVLALLAIFSVIKLIRSPQTVS